MYRKSRLDSFGTLLSKEKDEKNWIILNMKVGIYEKWLKLADYLKDEIMVAKKQKFDEL